MFHGKLFHFECDYCNNHEFVPLFPKKWVWIKAVNFDTIRHCCPNCTDKIDAKDKPFIRKQGQKN